MQTIDFYLKSDEIPRYFLYKHPIFATIGFFLLILSDIVCFAIFLPFIVRPLFELPFYPTEFLILLLAGFVLAVWLLLLFILSYRALGKYQIRTYGHITFNRQDKVFMPFLLIFIFLLFFQGFLINAFPHFSAIIQSLSYGLILILVCVMSYSFLEQNMPWFSKKEWFFETQMQKTVEQ